MHLQIFGQKFGPKGELEIWQFHFFNLTQFSLDSPTFHFGSRDAASCVVPPHKNKIKLLQERNSLPVEVSVDSDVIQAPKKFYLLLKLIFRSDSFSQNHKILVLTKTPFRTTFGKSSHFWQQKFCTHESLFCPFVLNSLNQFSKFESFQS